MSEEHCCGAREHLEINKRMLDSARLELSRLGQSLSGYKSTQSQLFKTMWLAYYYFRDDMIEVDGEVLCCEEAREYVFNMIKFDIGEL